MGMSSILALIGLIEGTLAVIGLVWFAAVQFTWLKTTVQENKKRVDRIYDLILEGRIRSGLSQGLLSESSPRKITTAIFDKFPNSSQDVGEELVAHFREKGLPPDDVSLADAIADHVTWDYVKARSKEISMDDPIAWLAYCAVYVRSQLGSDEEEEKEE
jgi:hypothetical protein